MDLQAGQVAVVTGAASGIGRALAQALTERGLTVVLADVEAGPLDEAAAALREHGGAAAVVATQVDVGDTAQMAALARRVLDRFGRVDLLGNVAGVVGPRAATWEQQPQNWKWTLQVNLWGVINGVHAFLPAMVAAKRGHVVNVSSIAGLAPVHGGGNAPYVASKYAVVGLSETLRIELDHTAPQVGVTVVCPGPVATRIREAERNRPAALQPAPPAAAVELAPFVPAGQPITAANVAAQIVAAVEANRLFLLPSPGTDEAVRARSEQLLAAAPDN